LGRAKAFYNKSNSIAGNPASEIQSANFLIESEHTAKRDSVDLAVVNRPQNAFAAPCGFAAAAAGLAARLNALSRPSTHQSTLLFFPFARTHAPHAPGG
jgi:hypothetical protein